MEEASNIKENIYGSVDYLTLDEMMAQFGEVLGKPAKFQQVPVEVFQQYVPPAAKEEMTENMLLLGDAGYYAGADVAAGLKELESQPKSWKQYVKENKAKWQ